MTKHRTHKHRAAEELAARLARLTEAVRPSRLTASALGSLTDKLTGAEVDLLVELVAGLTADAILAREGARYWKAWAQELQAAVTTFLSVRDELRLAGRVGIKPGPRSAFDALRAAAIPPADRKLAGPTFQEDRRAGATLAAEAADPLAGSDSLGPTPDAKIGRKARRIVR